MNHPRGSHQCPRRAAREHVLDPERWEALRAAERAWGDL